MSTATHAGGMDETLFAPFTQGLKERAIRMPCCLDCGRFHWYPQRRCPYCGAAKLEWRTLPPTGEVFASTVVRRTLVPGAGPPPPYGVALVSMDGAPQCRLVVNTEDPAGLPIGSAVDLVFAADGAIPVAVLRSDVAGG